MSGFSITEHVESLDYDFGKHGTKGTIADPTVEQVRQFHKNLVALYPSSEGEDDRTLVQRFLALPDDERNAINDQVVALVADLCNGNPSLELLQSLPARVRGAFVNWFLGQFADPSL